MNIIEYYEDVCKEPKNVMEKMNRINTIELAASELEISLELEPETIKELESIGIRHEQFIKRFQETENQSF